MNHKLRFQSKGRFHASSGALAVFALLVSWMAIESTSAAPVSSREANADRVNILLIMIDDLGPEWFSCYGSESVKTPQIDRLAATGTRFSTVYASPICTPTRVMLLTGQYPFRNGWTTHYDVPRWSGGQYFDWTQHTTFASVLRENGYATAIAGKWQINDLRATPDALGRHGFDEYCIWTGYESGNPPSGERFFDPYIAHNGQGRTMKGKFGPDVFTDFLIDFMKRNRDRPFLAYFPMVLTHPPLTLTPHNREKEGSAKLSAIERHKGMVRYVDHLVGRIVNTLDELNLRERTVIILTCDNGTSRGLTGRANSMEIKGGKGGVTERGVRVPLIVNAPGRVPAEAQAREELVDFTDLFPTILELTGIQRDPEWKLDGYSFADLLQGKPDDRKRRDWIFTQGAQRNRAARSPRVIRDRRFKLHDDGAFYDLLADPLETRDLSGSMQAEHVEARTRLDKTLRGLPSDSKPRFRAAEN